MCCVFRAGRTVFAWCPGVVALVDFGFRVSVTWASNGRTPFELSGRTDRVLLRNWRLAVWVSSDKAASSPTSARLPGEISIRRQTFAWAAPSPSDPKASHHQSARPVRSSVCRPIQCAAPSQLELNTNTDLSFTTGENLQVRAEGLGLTRKTLNSSRVITIEQVEELEISVKPHTL